MFISGVKLKRDRIDNMLLPFEDDHLVFKTRVNVTIKRFGVRGYNNTALESDFSLFTRANSNRVDARVA